MRLSDSGGAHEDETAIDRWILASKLVCLK
jgi:hypothetical protein